MREARIRTKFGEISITFQTTDELRDALQSLEEQVNTIQEMTKRIAPPPPRTAKPGYENAYRFNSNGDLERLYTPKFNHELVALVLFAYDPEPLSAKEIERITLITEVARMVLGTRQNKKFFRKVDDKYRLTPDGFTLVKERIGDVLARSAGTVPAEPEQAEQEQSE